MAVGSPRADARDATTWRGCLRPRHARRETTVPLRVELKPFERIVIGESVIINSGARTSFLIDGEARSSASETP